MYIHTETPTGDIHIYLYVFTYTDDQLKTSVWEMCVFMCLCVGGGSAVRAGHGLHRSENLPALALDLPPCLRQGVFTVVTQASWPECFWRCSCVCVLSMGRLVLLWLASTQDEGKGSSVRSNSECFLHWDILSLQLKNRENIFQNPVKFPLKIYYYYYYWTILLCCPG